MAITMNPYLSFTDECREAMEFYQSIFGGELTVSTFGEMGMEGEAAERIMHAQLTAGDVVLMASDTIEGMGMRLDKGNNVSCSLSGDDVETLTRYFQGLCEGGQVLMPLEKQVWGDHYGFVMDRFGIGWHCNIAGGAVEQA